MKRIKIIHRTDFRQFMMENTIIRNSLPKSAKHTFTNIHKYSHIFTMKNDGAAKYCRKQFCHRLS